MAYLVGLGDDARKAELKQQKLLAQQQQSSSSSSTGTGDGKILGMPPAVAVGFAAVAAWLGIDFMKKRRKGA